MGGAGAQDAKRVAGQAVVEGQVLALALALATKRAAKEMLAVRPLLRSCHERQPRQR